MKKTKKALVGLLSVMLLFMYSLGVCAACPENQHDWRIYNKQLVYEQNEICRLVTTCVINTKGYSIRAKCHICGQEKSYYETEVTHSKFHAH